MTRATFKGDSKFRLHQERVKYAMIGGSEVVVRTSIAYCDLRCTLHGAVVIRHRAPVPSEPSFMPLYDPCDLQGDFELRLPQERAKYAMLGGSEVVVGTSITSYDLMHARIVLWRSAAAPPPPPNPHTSQSMTLHTTFQSDSELRLSQERAN